MAGDAGRRRATSSRHRRIEKVFPADHHSPSPSPGRRARRSRWSACSSPSSSTTRRSRASRSARGQGEPALPDGPGQPPRGDAGARGGAAVRRFRRGRDPGRLFKYDVTGGRYEESDYATDRLGRRARQHRGSSWAGARASPRRGGRPRPSGPLRGRRRRLGHRRARPHAQHLPDRGAIDADGFTGMPDDDLGALPSIRRTSDRALSIDSIAAAAGSVAGREIAPQMSMPFYVSPEQLMKDRADYARKGIARGRSLVALRVRRRHRPRRREPVAAPSTRSPRSTTASRFAGVGKYNEFEQLRIAGIRHADLKGFSFAERTSTPAASPTSTPRRWVRSSPTR